jgi:hypothetical protein
MVVPKEGLLLGVDLISGHEENICLLLPRFQWSCMVTAKNGSENKLIVNGEMPCFFLILVDGLSMESMLFSKSSLRNFYNAFCLLIHISLSPHTCYLFLVCEKSILYYFHAQFFHFPGLA